MAGRTANDDDLTEVRPASRQDWREWLLANHSRRRGVWLLLGRRSTGQQPVSVDEAVYEALCFGWIDSRLRPIDETCSALLFTPRRRGSVWSRRNKQRVQELTEAGLMTEAGLRAIRTAQQDGSWQALDAVEDLQVPNDLAAALAAEAGAAAGFESLPVSVRKTLLWGVLSAKRDDTRARRIREAVHQAVARAGGGAAGRPRSGAAK